MSFQLNLALLLFFFVVLVSLEKGGLPYLSNTESFVSLLQLGQMFSYLKFPARHFLVFFLLHISRITLRKRVLPSNPQCMY